MWRKVLGLLWVGALAACTQPLRFCEQDSDCQQTQAGASCQQNVCFYDGETSSTACTPACADYQVCLASTLACAPRFSGVEVTPKSDATVGGNEQFVRAELLLAGNFEPKFPATLLLSVTSPSGTVSELPMQQEVAGTGKYLARWTPAGEGNYRLTVSYPDAQISGGPVTLKVDKTGPVLTVSLPPFPSYATDGGFVFSEPDAATAWRRDELVAVQVKSNAPDLDVRSLSVQLKGLDGGVELDGQSLSLTQVPCDAGYCGTVDVPLWKPALPAFRGTFAVEVNAKDQVGNEAKGSRAIPVTRWKWRYDIAAASIFAAPAVGNKGVLYVGTTNGGNNDGRIAAISDDGRLLWEAATGAVVSSPSVGNVLPNGSERVYVAHKKSSTSRVGFYAGSNTFNPTCADTSGSALIQSGLAIGRVSAGSGGALETVYGVYSSRSGGTIFALRPDAEDDSQLRCPTSLGVGDVLAPGTMLALGNSVIFGNSSGVLKSYSLASNGTWNSAAQWERALGLANPTALAIADGRVFGGSNNGNASKVFAAPSDGGQELTTIPTSLPAWNTSIGGGAAAKGVVGLGSNKLLVLSVGDGGTTTIGTPDDVVKGAPVWGSNGYVYTAGLTSGAIQARRPLETVEWQLDTESPIEASMNLDCTRSSDGGVIAGRPGVLYAASQDGKVFAIVVDSSGLDPSAPWPKYQHDSRNTGNPETPITSCP